MNFVSILVLMDLCIKTILCFIGEYEIYVVSILVLMDLCIKTDLREEYFGEKEQFQSLF